MQLDHDSVSLHGHGVVDAGVVEVTDDEQPRRYAAREIDLTVTTAAGDREYIARSDLKGEWGIKSARLDQQPGTGSYAGPAFFYTGQ